MMAYDAGALIRERDAELSRLRQLLADPGATGGRVVLMRGEAGIGKTALVAEFLAAVADDIEALEGGCDDLVTPQPFSPLWDVARLEPSLSAALGAGDRRRVMDVLLDLLARRPRPTVLVIEDTHWADEATLDVIRFLGRRIARCNGLLLLTYRSGAVDADHPLRQVIGDLPPGNLVRMQLDRLSADAVAAMIGDVQLDLEQVLTLTGGNPLFVTELVASGVDQVPSSIHDSVLARASRLSTEARLLLDLASIAPGRSERSFLEDVLGPIDEALRECERQGLLTSDGTSVSFPHELTRQAVETALSPATRRSLNERALAALVGRADPARLVHHAHRADDVAAIVDLAPQAARAAMAIESHREALAHFRALEPHLDQLPPDDRAGVLEDWASTDYLEGTGDAPELMVRAIELRRSLGDELALARTLANAVRPFVMRGQPERAASAADEAVALLEAHPPSADQAFAVSQRAWLGLLRGDEAEGSRIADRALAIANAIGDELTVVRAMIVKGACEYSLGDLRAVELVEEAQRLAQRGGHRLEEAYALANLTGMAGDVRDLARAEDLVRRTLDTAIRYELRTIEAYARAQYAEILLWKGDWDAAENEANEALTVVDAHSEAVAMRMLALIEVRRGGVGARALLDRVHRVAESSQQLEHLDSVAAVLAEHLWLSGDDDPDVLSRVRAIVDRGLATGSPWPSGALGFWWWKLGCGDVLPDGLTPVYRRVVDGEWQESAEFWASRGMPYEQALALMHGDDEAKLVALRIFEDLGAAPAAARVRDDLAAHGVRVTRGSARATRQNAAGLTARQAEVLELLAGGLSNAEIADRLFVSLRTVENHVAAVLMKLGVANRGEAVDAARARALLDHG